MKNKKGGALFLGIFLAITTLFVLKDVEAAQTQSYSAIYRTTTNIRVFGMYITIDKNQYNPGDTMHISSSPFYFVSGYGSYDAWGIVATVNGSSKPLFNSSGGFADVPFIVENTPGTHRVNLSFSAASPPRFFVGAYTSPYPWSPTYPLYFEYTVLATPINGTCGSADGTTVATAPTTNLCTSGTPTSVIGTGPWNWSCIGSNGGSTASCSANVSAPPPVYNCSQCSPIYSYANEAFTSYDITCNTNSNIGPKTYSQSCACGAKALDIFSYSILCAVPTATISATSPINQGQSSTLSWTTSDAASCLASGAWSGWVSNTGGSTTVTPASTSTYNLECWNGSGVSTGIKSATVTVNCTPSFSYTCAKNPTGDTCADNCGNTVTTQQAVGCNVRNSCTGATSFNPSVATCTSHGVDCADDTITCESCMVPNSWKEVAP